MFKGCTKLTHTPEKLLPATNLKEFCYRYMFQDCTSLVNAPELPATEMADNCYYAMFYGCTNLTQVQEKLPATTLAKNCYQQMFFGCTSLAKAPELPATTPAIGSYEGMFSGCTSLTESPKLQIKASSNAVVINGGVYKEMFKGCSALKKVTFLITGTELDVTLPSAVMTDWLSGVAATGTFYKSSNIKTYATGASGIPNGWTVADCTGN